MIPELLRQGEGAIESFSTRLVSGRFPLVKVAVFAFVLGMLLSFPRYNRLLSGENLNEWSGVLEKRDHPLKDVTTIYPTISHNSKVNFRLVVPLIAREFGLGIVGMFALQTTCSLIFLWLVAFAARRITGDDVCGFYLATCLATTWTGAQGWAEIRPFFDQIALLFLLGAVLSRGAVLAGSFVFLASWIDERGLIASSLVYLYHSWRVESPVPAWRAYLGRPQAGIVAGWVAYFALRVGLAWAFDMTTSSGDANAKVFLKQWNIYPLGCWSAFEGAWLILLAAAAVLILWQRFGYLALLTMNMFLVSFIACCVLDVTRSMTYMAPALFIALEILRKSEATPALRRILLVSALVSAAFPTYYVHERWVVVWFPPMPLQVIRSALGL